MFEELAGWFCGKTAPSTSSGTASTSRPAASQAHGTSTARCRRRHSRGVLARSHQLRLLGWRPNQPVPRLLLLYRLLLYRSGTSGSATPGPSSTHRRMARVGQRLTRRPSLRRRRGSPDPRAALLDFLQSAFEAGASLAGWDLADTAMRWCPIPTDRLAHLSVPTNNRPASAGSTAPATCLSRVRHEPQAQIARHCHDSIGGLVVRSRWRQRTNSW